MKTFIHRFRVYFDNVDFARVLYFPRQIDFFVRALEDFCSTGLGLSFRRMEEEDRVTWPTVHLEVDFKAPLHYEDEAEIAVSVAALGETSITFAYEVRRLPDRAVTCRAPRGGDAADGYVGADPAVGCVSGAVVALGGGIRRRRGGIKIAGSSRWAGIACGMLVAPWNGRGTALRERIPAKDGARWESRTSRRKVVRDENRAPARISRR
jgi:YbgC/YbaW family acyl-CoA thioester hydrolase